MMRGIGVVLGFKGESAILVVFDAAFADESAVEKIARVELGAGLISHDF